MQRLTSAQVLVPSGLTGPAAVSIDDGRITAVEPWNGPTDHHLLAPGFVDLQVNGIDDVDVAVADGATWDRLDQLVLQQGTTTWCPTLVTTSFEGYAAALGRIAGAMDRPARVRPSIAGAHLEGPFLGGRRGAHRPDLVRPLDLGWISELPPHVAMMTIGAELEHSTTAIALLRSRGVLVSIGHTAATHSQVVAAVDAGAAMATHLFNAMTGLDHREPGVAATVLLHPGVAASIIADGVHVHPSILQLACRLLGPDRTVLVTDSVAWRAGTAGSVGLELRDGAPRLPDGTLAGSMLRMDRAVRVCSDAGVPLEHALRAASTVPARLLGLDDRGRIDAGCRADLVALDETLSARATWVGGELAWSAA